MAAMTLAQVRSLALSFPNRSGASRWLLLGSLALNLFFIGAAVAMLVNAPSPPDRSIAARIERIASTLPQADGDLLRRAYQADRTAVDGTRAAYEAKRDDIRAALRHEPFDVTAMRAAMAETRKARQTYSEAMQALFADTAARMSADGRKSLADWGSDKKK
jgi:uncharacterized membrane protein